MDWHRHLMLVRIAPLIFVCLWATGFIGARLGLPYSEAGTFLSLRFALAFVLLTIIAMIYRAPWPGMRHALYAVLVGFFIHGVYLGAIFWVIDQGMPAGVSAVIVGLQPLVVAFIAAGWLGELITKRHWVGLIIGIMGVFLVLYPKFDISGSGVTWLTILIAFIGMMAASVGTVLQKKVGASTDLRTGTALQYLGAFLPVFLLALTSETGQIDWTAEMTIAMVWSLFVLSFVAIFLLMWLIREGSVARVSSLMFLVPAVTSIMAYFMFGDRLIFIQFVGIMFSAVAVGLVAYSGGLRATNSPDPSNFKAKIP